MNPGNNIDDFLRNLSTMAKSHVKVQTAWVTVKSVDWVHKTMTATGVLDELDYNNVLLGIGGCYRKPKENTRCLVGLIENLDAAAFLIEAQEVDEIIYNIGTTVYRATTAGHEIKTSNESLITIMDDLLQQLLELTVTTSAGPSGTPINAVELTAIKNRLKNLFI